MRIDRILFPTDFSECAERAFSHASDLAARYGAEIHVLNVSPGTPARSDPMGFVDLQEESSNVRSDAVRSEGETPDVQMIHSQIKAGSPVQGILDYAESHRINLIVMATHGRTGIDHLLSGSVAEDVVRHAKCPTFTVRCMERTTWRDEVKRILVPVDLSENSLVAPALDLARSYGAEVDLLHVIEEAVLPTIYGVEPLSPGAPLYLERTAGAMAKVLEAYDTKGLIFRTHVRVGNPARRILEFATEQESDMIVIGSRGREGLGRLLMGSVAEKVVRLSDVPVFTCKTAPATRAAWPLRPMLSDEGTASGAL